MSRRKRSQEPVEVVSKTRQHAGGPVVYLQPNPRTSKRRRGLAQTNSPNTRSRVRVIMRQGVILEPARQNKITRQNPQSRVPLSESKLMARYARQAGVPAQKKPGPRYRNRPPDE